MAQNSENKKLMEALKAMIAIRHQAQHAVEERMRNRMIRFPGILPHSGISQNRCHREYEKVARASLRLESNMLRRNCLALEVRRRMLIEEVVTSTDSEDPAK